MLGLRVWQIVGWTMLHYFWVGAALGALALLGRRCSRSSAAGVRYLLALGSLLLLSGAPAAIALVVMQSFPAAAPREALIVEVAGRPIAVPPAAAPLPMAEGGGLLPAAGMELSAPAPAAQGSERFWAALELGRDVLALALDLRRAADVSR